MLSLRPSASYQAESQHMSLWRAILSLKLSGGDPCRVGVLRAAKTAATACSIAFAMLVGCAPFASAQVVTRHHHDDGSRLLSSENSNGGSFSYEYDPSGNIKTLKRQLLTNDADLLLYLPFDDCNATNAVISGLSIVTVGTPSCVPGRSGKALHFEQGDRLNAWVDSRFSSTDITISVWIRPTGPGDHNPRIAGVGPSGTSGQYYSLILDGTDADRSTWACCYGGTSTISQRKISTGGPWTHVAVTFQGQTAALYIDGALDTLNSSYPALNGFSAALLQVAYSDNGLDQFIGDLDELRIYRRALSASELASLYGQGR